MVKIPWFKVDDQLSFHAKTVLAGNSAMGLWVRAGAWASAHFTDGFIPAHMANAMANPMANTPDPEKLVESTLWDEAEGGYQFHDWDLFQPDSKSEKKKREEVSRARSEAGKKGAEARWKAENEAGKRGKSDGKPMANASTDDDKPMAPSRPDPSSIPKGIEPSPQKAQKKRETTIPDDWTPTEAHAAKAKEKGVHLETEAENFKLHAQAHDRRLVNWNAGFSTWLNKARPSGGPGGRPPGQQFPPRQSAAEREMQIAKERHERIGNGQLGKPLSWDQVFQPKQIEDAT